MCSITAEEEEIYMLYNSHYCTQDVLMLHSLALIGFQCVWSSGSVLIVKTSSRKEVPALSLLHTLRVKWPVADGGAA